MGGKAIFPGCLAKEYSQHSWTTVTDGISYIKRNTVLGDDQAMFFRLS